MEQNLVSIHFYEPTILQQNIMNLNVGWMSDPSNNNNVSSLSQLISTAAASTEVGTRSQHFYDDNL